MRETVTGAIFTWPTIFTGIRIPLERTIKISLIGKAGARQKRLYKGHAHDSSKTKNPGVRVRVFLIT